MNLAAARSSNCGVDKQFGQKGIENMARRSSNVDILLDRLLTKEVDVEMIWGDERVGTETEYFLSSGVLDQGRGKDLICRDARRNVGASLCFLGVEV